MSFNGHSTVGKLFEFKSLFVKILIHQHI